MFHYNQLIRETKFTLILKINNWQIFKLFENTPNIIFNLEDAYDKFMSFG